MLFFGVRQSDPDIYIYIYVCIYKEYIYMYIQRMYIYIYSFSYLPSLWFINVHTPEWMASYQRANCFN